MTYLTRQRWNLNEYHIPFEKHRTWYCSMVMLTRILEIVYYSSIALFK